jgi:hypothetical protein
VPAKAVDSIRISELDLNKSDENDRQNKNMMNKKFQY